MKKSELRQIIREELQRLDEGYVDDKVYLKKIHAALLNMIKSSGVHASNIDVKRYNDGYFDITFKRQRMRDV